MIDQTSYVLEAVYSQALQLAGETFDAEYFADGIGLQDMESDVRTGFCALVTGWLEDPEAENVPAVDILDAAREGFTAFAVTLPTEWLDY